MALSSQLRFELPAGIRAGPFPSSPASSQSFSAPPQVFFSAQQRKKGLGRARAPASKLLHPVQYEISFRTGLFGRYPPSIRRARVEKSAREADTAQRPTCAFNASTRALRDSFVLPPGSDDDQRVGAVDRSGRAESAS